MKPIIIIIIILVILKSEVIAKMSVTVFFSEIRATIKIKIRAILFVIVIVPVIVQNIVVCIKIIPKHGINLAN